MLLPTLHYFFVGKPSSSQLTASGIKALICHENLLNKTQSGFYEKEIVRNAGCLKQYSQLTYLVVSTNLR